MLQSATLRDFIKQIRGLGRGWHIANPIAEYFWTIQEFNDGSYDLLWADEEFQKDKLR